MPLTLDPYHVLQGDRPVISRLSFLVIQSYSVLQTGDPRGSGASGASHRRSSST